MPCVEGNRAQSVILTDVVQKLSSKEQSTSLAATYSDISPSSAAFLEAEKSLLSLSSLENSNIFHIQGSVLATQGCRKSTPRRSPSTGKKMSRSPSGNSRNRSRRHGRNNVVALSPKSLFEDYKQERVSFSHPPASKKENGEKICKEEKEDASSVLDNSSIASSAVKRRLMSLPHRKSGVPGSPFMSQQQGNSAFTFGVPSSGPTASIPDTKIPPVGRSISSASGPSTALDTNAYGKPPGKNILSQRKSSLYGFSSQIRPVSFSDDPNWNCNKRKKGRTDPEGISELNEKSQPHVGFQKVENSPPRKNNEDAARVSGLQGAERVTPRGEMSASPNLPSFSNPFMGPSSSVKKEESTSRNDVPFPGVNLSGNNCGRVSLVNNSMERPVAMSPRSLTRRASVLVDSGVETPTPLETSDYFNINLEKIPEWKYKVHYIEWIQVPVLFDLLTYLIQFHELQEENGRASSEISMIEEALSCLISRISFSIFQVNGILLNSLFTEWESKQHKELFRSLVAAWRKGVHSQEFKDSSVKVLHAISTNDISYVTFTKAYRAWRWCSSFHNNKLTIGGMTGLAVFIIGLAITLFVGSTFSINGRAILLVFIILLTILLFLWSIVIATHNFYADAASTFFRENARSSVQLDSFFNRKNEEEQEDIVTPLSPEAKTATILTNNGRRRNSTSFLSNPHSGQISCPIGNNQTTSQYSFISVLSNSANRGDDAYRFKTPENGPDDSSVLHQMNINNPTLSGGPLDKVGCKYSQSVNSRGAGRMNNDVGDAPAMSSSPFKSSLGNQSVRSRTVVKVDSNTTDGSGSAPLKPSKSTDGSPLPQEEKRLKRSESKKYLFSRSLTGPGGTSSIQSSLVVALVLVPAHLCSKSNDAEKKQPTSSSSKVTVPPDEFPLMTSTQYNNFLSSLESRGFTVVKFTNIGRLDEAFHQGVNKSNIILLPNELWVFNIAMRGVVVRWLSIEFRSIFFFSAGPKSQDSKSNASSSCPSLCGSPFFTGTGEISSFIGAFGGRSRGGFSELNDLNVSVDDPFPPQSLCVYIPIEEHVKNKLYDSAVDRAQSKKAIFHSYVPPYSLRQRLGGGAFASVFSAVLDETGTRCAVKRIQLRGGDLEEDEESDKLLRSAVEEIELLSTVFHPNIVRYMYTERTGNTLSIFMERCGGGTLHSLLSNVWTPNGQQLTAVRVKRMLTEIMSAVAFLHVKLIIHRDLKPDNILLHEDGTVRLVDFGSAGLRKDNFAKMEGTLAYMAPEVLLEMPYGKECDIWSVGCVAADIFGVELPQKNMGFVELHEFFGEMKDAPNFVCEEDGVRCFLLKCLRKDPTQRVQCIDLLQDEILTPSSTAIEKCLEKSLEQRQNMLKRKGSAQLLGSLPSDSNMSLWSTQI